MELKRAIYASLLADDGSVISSDRLEEGSRIEVAEPAGESPASGQEYVNLYVDTPTGRRLRYRARAADVDQATGERE